MNQEIVVPAHCVVVLIGAAGSGKSTFAARWFTASEILSSDAFRATVGLGEDDQSATGRAFAHLHRALAERLARGAVAIVDATNIGSKDRRALIRRAGEARAQAVAIVLDMTLAECLEGNARRAGRQVSPAVVVRQWTALRGSLDRPDPFAGEGFSAVHRLVGHIELDSAVVRRGEVG